MKETVSIIHSDRGSQYTAKIYCAYSENNNFNLSYSAKGCPYGSAPMQSFNSIIKKELVNPTHYETFEQAHMSIFTFIEKLYNRERIHGSIKLIISYYLEVNKVIIYIIL